MEINRFNQLRDASARTEHKDLSAIAANQIVDGIPVINRTKTMLSPFADIVKTPNYTENAGNLAGYSIEIEDDAAPHGYRHVGNVSERYLLLTNARGHRPRLRGRRGSGLPWSIGRAFWDGGKYAVVVDFGDDVSQDVSASGDGSDRVGLSLVFRTSYDTSWRFEAALMGRRFLCDNGLLSGEFFGRVSFKHTTGSASADWQNVVRDGLRLVHRAPHDLAVFVRALRLLRQAQTSDRRLREVIGAVPAVRRLARRQGHAPVRRARGADAVRIDAGRDERALARPEADGGASWGHNDALVTGLVSYAADRLN